MRPRVVGLPVVGAAAVVVTAASILWLDQPIANGIDSYGAGLRPLWHWIVTIAEYASGLVLWKWLAGAVLLAVAVTCAIVPRWRGSAKIWLFAATVHILCRFSAGMLKKVFERLRPFQWIEENRPESTFFYDGASSFPSGHTAHFLSLVLPLVIVKPRVGVPLLVVPLLVGIARIGTNDHFVGDVTGAIGWTVVVTWLLSLLFEVDSARKA
jgi:membrane-associated phospholipid phosphatase